jgi:DNA-binding NarL/FixJ family response regulator
MNTQIAIAIIDDHTLFRDGVAGLLKEFDELSVLFQAENGRVMQQMLLNYSLPDVILMDINMPVLNGYESTKWLSETYPSVHVLALSMYEDDEAVIKMIKCGAGGYILKQARPRELLEAIKTLSEKGVYFNELVSGKLLRSVKNESSSPLLTGKETEFLKFVCSEMTYKEIADKMFVSPRTIDNYRESLFLKLNLKSRTGLVLYSIKNNIFNI